MMVHLGVYDKKHKLQAIIQEEDQDKILGRRRLCGGPRDEANLDVGHPLPPHPFKERW